MTPIASILDHFPALVIDGARPDVSLLSVEDFRELWRKHQDAGVADRNSASVAFQQFDAATRFPDSGLARNGETTDYADCGECAD